jgi:hypothetical protein
MRFDEDYRYAYTRVSDTFVYDTEKQELALVVGAENRYQNLVVRYCNKDCEEAAWDRFSFTPPQLGMINLDQSAFFVERVPKRRDWRQGLRSSQFRTFPSYSHNWLYSSWKYVNQTLKEGFSSLETAIEELEEFASVRAISRYFSIDDSFRLKYRGTILVGQITDDNTISLDQNYFWLKDQLESEVSDDVHVLDSSRPL